jgi:hypothetical protein
MNVLRRYIFILFLLAFHHTAFCWGFFAHKKINYYSVFLLPPQMMVFYKPHIQFITDHAVDPDKRRYIQSKEGARHYLDIDHYGTYPFDSLPRKWNDAVKKFSEDTLNRYGIVPWWIIVMQKRLTDAFKQKNTSRILKLSAEIGHYIADAHVPLHVSSNHNGQLTNQQGIHAFWESRIPELLADQHWNFFIGKADYITNVPDFIWKRVLESAAAADTVLGMERSLSNHFNPSEKFAFEDRNGKLVKQYSSRYAKTYNDMLQGMVERRMRQAIYATACLWYTAWVDAGQPDLSQLSSRNISDADQKEFEQLDKAWRSRKGGDERMDEEGE